MRPNPRLRLSRSAAVAALLAVATGFSPAETAGEVTEVTITTPAGRMRYEPSIIDARPGSRIRLTLRNEDAMPHNIVFCQPLADRNDRGLEVAQAAWTLGADGFAREWVPEHPRILAASRMAGAHSSTTLEIDVPETAGTYPFVCTFPGHAMAMNGELRVRTTGPGLTNLRYRLYLGDWDALPDFSALAPHREGGIPDNLLDIRLEGMAEHFGVQFTASIEAPEDGTYRFELASDDGARLFIDGKRVIDNDNVHPADRIRSARVPLTKGPHEFRVDYFEAAGEEHLYVAWSGATFQNTPLSRWVPESRISGGEVERDRFTGIPLEPRNGEAVIYRNFIRGSGPRGIAVGYPNGVNLCFDAGAVSPVLLWRGAFLDAKRHWTDRGAGFTEPLGFDVAPVAPEGPALAVVPDGHPWPKTAEKPGIRFRGYRLDSRRFPEFRYELGTVTATERWEPEGDYAQGNEAATRIVTLTSDAPPPGLLLRAATGNIHPHDSAWKVGNHLVVSTGHAFLRGTGSSRDLVVRPAFTDGRAEVRIRYHWLSQISQP